MQVVSFAEVPAPAVGRSANEMPTAPALAEPTRKKSRRVNPSQKRTAFLL
jgi:hypothetical protein